MPLSRRKDILMCDNSAIYCFLRPETFGPGGARLESLWPEEIRSLWLQAMNRLN